MGDCHNVHRRAKCNCIRFRNGLRHRIVGEVFMSSSICLSVCKLHVTVFNCSFLEAEHVRNRFAVPTKTKIIFVGLWFKEVKSIWCRLFAPGICSHMTHTPIFALITIEFVHVFFTRQKGHTHTPKGSTSGGKLFYFILDAKMHQALYQNILEHRMRFFSSCCQIWHGMLLLFHSNFCCGSFLGNIFFYPHSFRCLSCFQSFPAQASMIRTTYVHAACVCSLQRTALSFTNSNICICITICVWNLKWISSAFAATAVATPFYSCSLKHAKGTHWTAGASKMYVKDEEEAERKKQNWIHTFASDIRRITVRA